MSPSRQAFSTLEPAVALAAGGSPDRPTLVIAATSARLLAEAARASGFEVIAIDVFGDVDTRAAARTWMPLGIPGRLAPEEDRLVAALRQCATPPRPVGWIAGSGFESAPGLLATGAGVLPLLGNLPGTVTQVRDPDDFFAALHRLGIPAPEISLAPPADPAGWLFKDAHACGGWHIRPAGRAPAGRGPGAYFQREEAGTAMSALFLANGASALIVGFARQIVASLGRRPYVYRGCVGPVTLPPPHAGQVANAVSALTRHYGLRGLNGIDFLFERTESGCWNSIRGPRPALPCSTTCSQVACWRRMSMPASTDTCPPRTLSRPRRGCAAAKWSSPQDGEGSRPRWRSGSRRKRIAVTTCRRQARPLRATIRCARSAAKDRARRGPGEAEHAMRGDPVATEPCRAHVSTRSITSGTEAACSPLAQPRHPVAHPAPIPPSPPRGRT
ncbi:ATP-grasp domain-containing protein [Thauera humireducens]|uniref:ATP-grasp domain-containing protein n=1 Tax=Thauera humireducens TaxID=1134435 RepID=UPI00311D88A7